MMKDPALFQNNELCPECGAKTDPNICAAETGFNYCSDQCAKDHVESYIAAVEEEEEMKTTFISNYLWTAEHRPEWVKEAKDREMGRPR